MPLFSVDDAIKLWQSIANDPSLPSTAPDLLYCGSFDYKLQAFPVMSLTSGHHVWIPVEWKFAFRFLNHVMYCLWHASRDPRVPDVVRDTNLRATKYAERLRSGFLNEVLEYWYPPGTLLPTDQRPTHQGQPLHSCYLTSFLANMFTRETPIPAPKDICPLSKCKSDPATLNWDEWAKKKATNRTLYGALPAVGTVEHRRLAEENKAARILHAPSVEINSCSWTSYTAEVLAMYSNTNSTVPSRRSCCTAETHTSESTTPSEPKTKRRKRSSVV